MVPYNKDKQPGLSQWAGGAMNAVVVLDQGGNVSYTNLDEIGGKVVVKCGKSADVSSIVVKLEGESRSRLMSPPGPNGEKPRPQLEYHKILYKVQMVFPPADVVEGRASKSAYTLPPGQHEYPFKFKIPFNNSCASDRSQMATMNISGSGLEVARPPSHHVKKTLPPTLSGFPGEAEIRYFVKATVQRHSWYKENTRTQTPFNFFPIEPPRPPASGSEVYARQRHAFNAFEDGDPVKSKMKGIFGMKKEMSASPTTADAPSVSVDARLPDRPILTCNQELPLRIIVKKMSDYSDPIYLQSLQVSLVGLTKVRAHDVHRTEANTWIIMSKSNMRLAIGTPPDPVGTETVIDDHTWRGQTLPNTVAPSFETCNTSRSYQLDVRVGLSYSGNVPSSSKPQTIVLPLRLDTEVFSGITPPPALLEAIAQAKANGRRASTAPTLVFDKLRTEGRMPSDFGAGQVPPTPMDDAGSSGLPEIPAGPGIAADAQFPAYSEAPPSYEDAIATNLPPIDAPRPDYAPPPPAEDDEFRRDEKRGWVDHHE